MVNVAAGQAQRFDLGELSIERLGGYQASEEQKGRVDRVGAIALALIGDLSLAWREATLLVLVLVLKSRWIEERRKRSATVDADAVIAVICWRTSCRRRGGRLGRLLVALLRCSSHRRDQALILLTSVAF